MKFLFISTVLLLLSANAQSDEGKSTRFCKNTFGKGLVIQEPSEERSSADLRMDSNKEPVTPVNPVTLFDPVTPVDKEPTDKEIVVSAIPARSLPRYLRNMKDRNLSITVDLKKAPLPHSNHRFEIVASLVVKTEGGEQLLNLLVSGHKTRWQISEKGAAVVRYDFPLNPLLKAILKHSPDIRKELKKLDLSVGTPINYNLLLSAQMEKRRIFLPNKQIKDPRHIQSSYYKKGIIFAHSGQEALPYEALVRLDLGDKDKESMKLLRDEEKSQEAIKVSLDPRG